MTRVWAIFKRELQSYFSTPVAYVFIAIFLFLTGLFTFSERLGGFYESRQADLSAFFNWHPWLYLFLIPAVSMRLWSEERRSGTVELLMTLPIPLWSAVVGKFMAAWVFVAIALALTFPVILTVTFLGDPDLGVILAGYAGSFLMAGAYLAIGCCISALTKSQVISLIITVLICFMFVLAGFGPVQDWVTGWAPQWLVDAVDAMGFTSHYSGIMRGVLELNDLIFFVSMIVAWLYTCAVVLEAKKAD